MADVAGTSPATAAPYAAAQSATDAQARATLAQLASAGTAGQAAYQGQQQAGQGDKSQAISSLLSSAMFKGIPGQSVGTPPSASPAPGIVAQAFDQRLGTTGALGDAFKQASDTRSQGAQTYFDEAKAALPVIQAQTDQRIGMAHDRMAAAHQAAQDRANAAAQSQAISLQLKELGLENALARSANGGHRGLGVGTGQGVSPLAQFIKDEGGPALAGEALPDLILRSQIDESNRNIAAGAGTGPSGEGGGNFTPDAGVLSSFDSQLNAPGSLEALMRDAQQRQTQQAGATPSIRSSPAYQEAEANVVAGLNAGGTYEQFVANLTKNVTDPVVQHQLLADYGPVFRQRDSDNRAQTRLTRIQ